MRASRREVIFCTAATAALPLLCSPALSQLSSNTPPLPKKDSFESGDLVWPKKPGAFVPYNSGLSNHAQRDEEIWLKERENFIDRVAKNPGYFREEDIRALRRMSFREFYARYAGDQVPGIPGAYSSGAGLYVGHVGIIDLDQDGVPWVIEAIWGKGVIRSKYDDWIEARSGEIVWHGRTRQLSRIDRAKIAEEGRKYLGRPYDFWNFDLNSDVGFYCSKLVWMSIWRALKFPIDGNETTQRVFWFSPKQLLYAKTLTRLHDPGPYANL